jgi:hypothetical protein
VQRHFTTLTPKVSLRIVEVLPKQGIFGTGHFVRTTHDPA